MAFYETDYDSSFTKCLTPLNKMLRSVRAELGIDSDAMVTVRNVMESLQPCASCGSNRGRMQEFPIIFGGIYSVYIVSCFNNVCSTSNSLKALELRDLLEEKRRNDRIATMKRLEQICNEIKC